MLFRRRRRNPTPRRPINKPNLNQIRLIHILNGLGLFADTNSQRLRTHRPATIILNNRLQYPTIHIIQPERIDIQLIQRLPRNIPVNRLLVLHVREVPHTPQQTIRDMETKECKEPKVPEPMEEKGV